MKKLLFGAIMAVLTLGFVSLAIKAPNVYAAQPTVDLGTAKPFAILAGTPDITDAGHASVITGNVGLSPASGAGIGLLSTQVIGSIYAVNGAGPSGSINNPDLLTTAKSDLTTAYTNAAGRTPVNTINTELGGQHLYAGVYTTNSTALQITGGADGPGPLVLDAQNDASAVFIFEGSDEQAGSLTVGPGGTVSLINGASACNVFWRVYGATINTSAVFKGNILALTSITVANGASIEGRLLARNGEVTLNTDTITAPVCTNTTVTPKLPNTGSTSLENNRTLLAISIAAVAALITLASFIIVRTKRAN